MEGNYYCDAETLRELEAEDRIAFRYATPTGEITASQSQRLLGNIAGILNKGRNVLGMMPHPDRSSESLLGSADGYRIFASMLEALAAR
jgi:phosphoribosylformylglycinamidine (FGAM) synthase-like amidotransferase family enzyme